MELFFGHDINIEQTQKLTLTPEMIQSLNILQFSRGELYDYVYSEMIENPVTFNHGAWEWCLQGSFRDDRRSDCWVGDSVSGDFHRRD